MSPYSAHLNHTSERGSPNVGEKLTPVKRCPGASISAKANSKT